MNKLNILPCRDTYDTYTIDKGDLLSKLPSKILIVGKSAISGKSTVLSNLVNRPEYYGNDFEGDNIYLISGSTNSDEKIKNIIKFKKIPEENVFSYLDDEVLEFIMEQIKEKYNEAIEEDEKPKHSLVIFDDISYDSKMSKPKDDKIGELVCNMRHYLTTCIFTAQKMTQLSRTIRVNSIMNFIFKQPLNELETITNDICYIDKKKFKSMFNKYTKGKHDMFIANLDAKDPKNIYCACGTDTSNCIRSLYDLET
jgi:hypothetical protein